MCAQYVHHLLHASVFSSRVFLWKTKYFFQLLNTSNVPASISLLGFALSNCAICNQPPIPSEMLVQKKKTHLCRNMHNIVAYHANLKTNHTSISESDKLIVSWESKTQIWLQTHKNRKHRHGADKHNLRASCSWSAQLANAPSGSPTPPCRSVSQLLRNCNFSRSKQRSQHRRHLR